MSGGVLLQNPTHMRHPSPPHGVGQMSPHPIHGHMMPQMGQVRITYVVALPALPYFALNRTQLALELFSQFSAAVVRPRANDGALTLCVPSERGLVTILHCLEWYKLVLRTCLLTLAVRYLVRNHHAVV